VIPIDLEEMLEGRSYRCSRCETAVSIVAADLEALRHAIEALDRATRRDRPRDAQKKA